jgi:hypothetical protein
MACTVTAAAHGDTHYCGKDPDHTGSTNASRRVHQDFITGHRWPTTLDDDPLRDFVHVVSRDSLGEAL